MPLTDLQMIIKEYNEEYDLEIDDMDLANVACQAKILKYDGSFSLRFCNKNYLAYFVAKALNRRSYINIEETILDIEYTLNNICFGINDNIILFISYLTSNPRIIMLINQAAESLMKEWEEFDLDRGNIKYISTIKVQKELSAPKSGDKEKIEELETQYEEKIKEDSIIELIITHNFSDTHN